MFIPENPVLGEHREKQDFSYTITYEYIDEFTGLPEEYPVTLTPISNIPPSINITENTISGQFIDSFDHRLEYLSKAGNYNTVPKFSDVNNVDEMIAYYASQKERYIFEFLASANNETKTYQIIIVNNWTAGMLMLIDLVKGTI